MRRRWLFATVAMAVLALGALGGTVLAQETTENPGKAGIFGRVAEILGIGEDDLKGAFDQAKTEIREEKSDAKFDKLVESGKLTEEQAAELREWMDARPEVDGAFGSFGPQRKFRGHGFGRRGGHQFQFRIGGDIGDVPDLQGRYPEFQEHLDALRERGAFRQFEDPEFRFFFRPSGGLNSQTDETPASGGVSL